jgi:hypothetical protein
MKFLIETFRYIAFIFFKDKGLTKVDKASFWFCFVFFGFANAGQFRFYYKIETEYKPLLTGFGSSFLLVVITGLMALSRDIKKVSLQTALICFLSFGLLNYLSLVSLMNVYEMMNGFYISESGQYFISFCAPVLFSLFSIALAKTIRQFLN